MTESFRAQYATEPQLWVRAPGRVDLMGSHTDYNEGFVLTLPIDRDTWIAARQRDDDQVRLFSLNLNEAAAFDLHELGSAARNCWAAYIQGVAFLLQQQGYRLRGFDGVVHSTVPLRSGLSSSAALEAAAAWMFCRLGGFTIEPLRMAQLCQKAENEYVGMNCGILDQYTSILGEAGSAIVLDCRALTHGQVRLPDSLRVVVCNTCAPRQLVGSEYGERRAQCEEGARRLGAKALRDVTLDIFQKHEAELPAVVAKRCRFIIEENDRVLKLAAALEQDDRAAIQSLTAASYRGARDLFEIGAPAMAAMINAMESAPGMVGCRQAGAGFGGCMVAFVDAPAVERFVGRVTDAYRQMTGITPEVYAVKAAAGAGVLLE